MVEIFIEKVQGDALRDNRKLVHMKAFIAGSPVLICPACGKPYHFMPTAKGKKMPCEITLKVGDNKMTLLTHSGVTVRRASPDVFGYEPHFGHCERRRKSDRPAVKEGGAL